MVCPYPEKRIRNHITRLLPDDGLGEAESVATSFNAAVDGAPPKRFAPSSRRKPLVLLPGSTSTDTSRATNRAASEVGLATLQCASERLSLDR